MSRNVNIALFSINTRFSCIDYKTYSFIYDPLTVHLNGLGTPPLTLFIAQHLLFCQPISLLLSPIFGVLFARNCCTLILVASCQFDYAKGHNICFQKTSPKAGIHVLKSGFVHPTLPFFLPPFTARGVSTLQVIWESNLSHCALVCPFILPLSLPSSFPYPLFSLVNLLSSSHSSLGSVVRVTQLSWPHINRLLLPPSVQLFLQNICLLIYKCMSVQLCDRLQSVVNAPAHKCSHSRRPPSWWCCPFVERARVHGPPTTTLW